MLNKSIFGELVRVALFGEIINHNRNNVLTIIVQYVTEVDSLKEVTLLTHYMLSFDTTQS